MPNEPINIFSARDDAQGVLSYLRGLFPDAEVRSAGGTWTTITVRFGSNGGAKSLTFLHDPAYYAGPDWSRQRAGMQGYFDRFPAGDRASQLRSTIDSLRFALGTSFEPDFDPEGDERLGVVFGVARLLDGVLFTPSSLRDADGRVLVGADGEADADAVWPMDDAVVLTPLRAAALAAAEGRPRPPGPKRVARRAVALMGVVGRAVIEREVRLKRVAPEHADGMHDRLLRWLTDVRGDTEFEPAEEAVVQSAPGRLHEQHFLDAMWRVEGLALLGWALGRLDLPRYDELVSIDAVWDGMAFLEADEIKALLAKPPLRPPEQLEAVRRQVLAYHWRLSQFRHVAAKAMDFEAFARDCRFGPLDLSPFELVDGDLALQGRRIDTAPAELLDSCCSIAAERHRAINWLCQGPDRYSEADIST
jgi:hypothetical protein